MDVSAILYGAIGGGGGAALGVLIFRLIQKLRKKPFSPGKNDKVGSGLLGGLSGGLAVAGLTLVPSLYQNMVLPRLIPMDFAKHLGETPIYSVIKEQSPEDYKLMIASIDKAARNNDVSQEIINDVRAVYFELIAQKTKIANAENLRALDVIYLRQMLVYKEKVPKICTMVLNGETFPDVSKVLSAEDAKAEQDVMVKLFTRAPRDPNFVANLSEGQEVFTKIFTQSMTELEITNIRPEITDDDLNVEEHRRICDLSISYTNKKAELSDNELINVTEYLARAK